MILFRPVGLEELRLVHRARNRAFPPRLPEQPIFYPVTNEGYAVQIARDWNVRAGTRAGFVTRFAVEDTFASRFERRVVGAKEHEELWVPAEELDAFNDHLEGSIEVVSAFFGDDYRGQIPEAFGLRGKTAREQFVTLARGMTDGSLDVGGELVANHEAVFLNFFFWEQGDFAADGIGRASRDAMLASFREILNERAPGGVALGVARP